jgi:hypothetical protein
MRLLRTAFAVSLLCSVSPGANALSYRLVSLDDGRCGYDRSCPLAVIATGEIGRDEFETFRAFAGSLPSGTRMPRDFIIHSAGGNVGGALKLGLAIRALGLNATVGGLREGGIGRGFCGSACVFVLMGGRTRNVAPGSIVAVHSPKRVVASLDPQEVGSTELGPAFRNKVVSGLMDYARAMGVDPALVRLSMTVRHTARRVLTAAEIRRFRLAAIRSRS